MQKRKVGRTFSRKPSVRKALIVSVASALVQREKIKTTEAKAKEIRPFIEKFITKSKTDNLHTRRELLKYFTPQLAKKLVEDIGPRYKDRHGGYTRITKMGPRNSDSAKMAVIEFV